MIGPDGRMNDAAGELAGLTQDEAEERILAWIREHGLLVKREAYRHTITLCERCKSRIEPLISLQWWCRMDELKQPALAALREGRVQLPPALAASLRDRVARKRARLEHLTTDLVGPPAPRLGVPRRASHRPGNGPGSVRRMRLGRADAQRGRSRHLVLIRALALRDPGLAGGDARARGLVSRHAQHDCPRDHPPLGEPDDLLRARADGRGSLPARDHPYDGARLGRAPDVEEPRHRARPARADRPARGGLDPLRAAEAVLLAGRAFLRGRGRGGAQAGEQAVERLAADPRQRR